jgi:hypothetical protein
MTGLMHLEMSSQMISRKSRRIALSVEACQSVIEEGVPCGQTVIDAVVLE